MPQITFILKDGSQKQVDAPLGLSLMEVAVKEGIEAYTSNLALKTKPCPKMAR